MDIEQILSGGIVFKKGGSDNKPEEKKIKTKAKKTTYVKGTHGSGAAKMKAEYKRKKASRNKK